MGTQRNKSKETIAEYFSSKEIQEMKYSINKELAWKQTQLLQLQKGLISNSEKIQQNLKDNEVTQEDWLKDKISILEKIKAKLKILSVEKTNNLILTQKEG